jgi:V/A-type H+-transporting ATPase subunit E
MDKLYNEGLSKGRKDADELVAKAAREAEEIISNAKEKAAKIVSKAEQEADDIKSRIANDIKMASAQSITATKQSIENLVVANALNANIGKAMSDTEFVKSLLTTVVKAFNASNAESVPLEVILPSSMQKELQSAFATEIYDNLAKGSEVKFAKGMSDGFKIGPKDGGFVIGFTADDFNALLGSYLRPSTRKLLFGE